MQSSLVPLLLDLAALVLLVGLALAIVRYRSVPQAKAAVVIVALAIGLSAVVGVWAYSAYQTYVSENTWSFGYALDVRGNGTAPESLIVPIVLDESLLTGLHLSSGAANWSFVNTTKGRGLFVSFTGAARIEAAVSTVPRPAVFPDTRPTMTVFTNCTAQPSNCTGPPSVWVFYGGAAGAWMGLSIGSYSLAGYLTVGWAPYATWPQAVPTA